jgi:hypothetical protein
MATTGDDYILKGSNFEMTQNEKTPSAPNELFKKLLKLGYRTSIYSVYSSYTKGKWKKWWEWRHLR